MKQVVILLSIFVLSSSLSFADVDEFNTYRWNRKNVLNNTGRVDKRDWFEWWYYKIVLPETNKSFFFVYGVVNPWDKENVAKGTRSYIGMGDFAKKIQVEEIFSVDEFYASYEDVDVTVGSNSATDKFFNGTIVSENGKEYQWDIEIDRKWTFNPEGPLMGKMITNIEWYSAQADARCSGEIKSDTELYKFEDVPCYQDRNWGRSFPQWWTWIVSNHFENSPGTALSIGGGKPKVLGMKPNYENVSVGLRYKEKDYIFSPFHLDKVKIDIEFGKWEVTGVSGLLKIEVTAFAPKDSFMDLQFMTPQGELFHDYETLNGRLEVKLYKRRHKFSKRWNMIDTLISNYAGIEYGSREIY